MVSLFYSPLYRTRLILLFDIRNLLLFTFRIYLRLKLFLFFERRSLKNYTSLIIIKKFENINLKNICLKIVVIIIKNDRKPHLFTKSSSRIQIVSGVARTTTTIAGKGVGIMKTLLKRQ